MAGEIAIHCWDGQDKSYWTETVSTGSATLASGQSCPDGTTYSYKFTASASGNCYSNIAAEPIADAFYYLDGSVNFWFKGTTTETSFDDIIRYARSGALNTTNFRLGADNTGQLKVSFDNGTPSNVTGATITSGWHYIQVAYDFSTTTHSVTVAVDGTSYTALTKSGASGLGIDRIRIGRFSTVTSYNTTKYYGPIVVSDAAGIQDPYWLQTFLATGDKNTNWTCSSGSTRYTLVGDTSFTTYIQSSTSGQIQQLDMGNITIPTGQSMSAVRTQVDTAAGVGTTPGADTYVVDSGGTRSTASSVSGLINNQLMSLIQLLDPDGAAWTKTVFDGCYFEVQKNANTDTCRIADVFWFVALQGPLITIETKTLTAGLSFTSAQLRKAKKTLTGALSFTSAQTRRTVTLVRKALTGALSFTGAWTRRVAYRKSLTAALSFSARIDWRQVRAAGGWIIQKVPGRRNRRSIRRMGPH